MTFDIDKRNILSKQDKSKKGSIDEAIRPLLELMNSQRDFYTTSSCSGRVYLWTGSGKKNETTWLRVHHGLIDEDFLKVKNDSGLIWLRLEPFILHVACRDMAAANNLLERSKKIYKKSCLLSTTNKIIVEVRGSEFLEMPLYNHGQKLFSGDWIWLRDIINQKMKRIEVGRKRFIKWMCF